MGTAPKTPNGCFGDAGFGIIEGVDLEVCASSIILGARGAALAKGELRTGRVLGLPRPSPFGVGAAETCTEASRKVAEDSSCGGDPVGVVLSPLIGRAGFVSFSAANADGVVGGDSDLADFTLEDSGFGVVEGDLVFASGVFSNGTSEASVESSGD